MCDVINCNSCITMDGINNVNSLRLLWRKYRSKPEAIEEYYEKLRHYSRRSKRIHPQ